jgi:hypothetical protein
MVSNGILVSERSDDILVGETVKGRGYRKLDFELVCEYVEKSQVWTRYSAVGTARTPAAK